MKQEIKREKAEDWAKAVNFIPKKDEIIIYDCEDGTKIKIGDGVHKVNELDFIDNYVSIANVNRVEDEVIIMED